MSGVNSWTHDPIAIGYSYKFAEEKITCHFCCCNVPESTIQVIDTYKLCPDCYEDYVNTPDED